MSDRSSSINEESLFTESYERALPWLEAVSSDDFEPINLDITSVVATVLGVLPEIRAMRSTIAAELPKFDLQNVDRLEDIARATSCAHTQYLTACSPPDELPEMFEEGAALRTTLRGDAEQLARRGLVNPAALDDLSGANGYKNLARDLQILVHVLREVWPLIEGKCGVETVELDRAERLAARVLRVVGLRGQGPLLVSTATENRLRAFTLLVRTYDAVRRAIAYLRWRQGDANQIAPSLWAGRGRRGKSSVEANSNGATPPTDAAEDSATAARPIEATSARPIEATSARPIEATSAKPAESAATSPALTPTVVP